MSVFFLSNEAPSSVTARILFGISNDITNFKVLIVITPGAPASTVTVSAGNVATPELPLTIGSLGNEIPGNGIGVPKQSILHVAGAGDAGIGIEIGGRELGAGA